MNGQWSAEEIAYLKDNHQTKSIKELCEHFGRDYKSVHQKLIRSLKIKPRYDLPHWTKEEEATLLSLVNVHRLGVLAIRLKKSRRAILQKLRLIGISYPKTTSVQYLADVIKSTGYDRLQLYRAKEALNQKWARLRNTKRARYEITAVQVRHLCDWLKNEGKPDSLSLSREEAA